MRIWRGGAQINDKKDTCHLFVHLSIKERDNDAFMAIDIKSLPLSRLRLLMEELGEKPFRAKQIFRWLHQRNASSFEQMTDLSKQLRDSLSEKTFIGETVIKEKFISRDNNTIKYLLELGNKNIIECVLMKYSYGNSICVSSQAGCRMGCGFCASAVHGLCGNLSAGEISAQIYAVQEDLGERISNVVIMGMGEPLDNFSNVIDFIDIISCKEGLNIGQRHITLSTCGLTDRIYMLADMNLKITLAVSLHAPNDEIRKEIMPVAKRYPLAGILEAAAYYASKTGRRITYEYALIQGVNDTATCAHELGNRLKGTLCHVNLIPVNEIKESEYKKSSKATAEAFSEILSSYKIETTIRRKLGGDINAACGQLRNTLIEV